LLKKYLKHNKSADFKSFIACAADCAFVSEQAHATQSQNLTMKIMKTFWTYSLHILKKYER